MPGKKRKAIMPDTGLLIAVERLSGGGAVHICHALRHSYLNACEKGWREASEIFAHKLRTKMVRLAKTRWHDA